MARYNCSFSIEKNTIEVKKFEVIISDSKDKAYLIKVLQKKYPGYSITIKKIAISINGKSEIL